MSIDPKNVNVAKQPPLPTGRETAAPAPLSPITIDRDNRELRTVVDYFKKQFDAARTVSHIRWLPNIVAGCALKPGLHLADIRWDDGKGDAISAPAGCEGLTISAIDPDLDCDVLHLRPSQVLLHLT